MPVAHVVAGELDAVGGPQSPLLAVEGLVVAEFFGEQEGSEARGEDAAGKEAGFERWGEGGGIGVGLAQVGLAFDDFAGEGGGSCVEAFADFFSDEAEVIGVGEDFGVGDGALGGGEALEGVEQFIGAFGAPGFCGFFSRRWFFVAIGGFALFCFIFKEGHEELIDAHLFAFGSVDAGEEGRDDSFLGFEGGFEFEVLLPECGDFGEKFFDLLVFAFDGFSKAGGVPDLDYLRYLSYFEPGALEAVAQVDAVGEHGKGGGLEDEFPAVAFNVFWPTEISSFQAFCDDPISSSIEV